MTELAQALVARGKGILAADESFGTIKKRLLALNIPSSAETRRAYRDVLFTTPGIEDFLSGVIMFEETLRQASRDGVPFPGLLSGRGIFPGVKVDRGTVPLAGFPGERFTEGLDALRERLEEYKALGACFTKWRAVLSISRGTPTRYCVATNARLLAQYAAISQEAGMAPIAEPEVLMDGDHDLARCAEVTENVLQQVFLELRDHRVLLEGMLLKPNMVLPGRDSRQETTPSEVAEATLRSLRRTVPAAVPGIVFLSGGQSPERATENLNAMNERGPHPWELSFSFARALQDPAMRAWAGEADNIEAAQRVFQHRAKMNSEARYGRYSGEMETLATAA